MSDPNSFIPSIEYYLRRAAALKVPERRPSNANEFKMRWPKYWTLDKQHLALSFALLETIFSVKLVITNGGFGCYKLTISIEGVDAETAARISNKILSDSFFKKLLENAGPIEITRDREREHRSFEEAALLDKIRDEETLITLHRAIALAENNCGITPNENSKPSERIAQISKQVHELKKADSNHAEVAEKSAWWLGDIVGGILGGFTKSMG